MEATAERQSWLARRLEGALRTALERAWESVRVEPADYLVHLRTAHRLPVGSYDGLFTVPMESLDYVAADTLRGAMKMAAIEGAGLGFGGFLTVVPDLGFLAGITLRTLQKLSLTYGFPFNTDDEVAELWIAAATAAGVDIGKDLLEKTVLRAFVERAMGRIAVRFSAEAAEKMAARAVPILSSAAGAVLNYYFIRAWGRRATEHFRQRHLLERERRHVILLGS